MLQTNAELKQNILDLPIYLGSKVELYLYFQGLKKGCELFVISPISPFFQKLFQAITFKRINHCINFCEKYHLRYKNILDSNIVLIANTKNDLQTLIDHGKQNPDHGSSQKMVQEMGRISGFPIAAVELYAKNITQINSGTFPDVFNDHESSHSLSYQKEYWAPYVQYIVRKNHEWKDSLIAKKWADTMINEFPELHKRFIASS